MNFAMSYSCGKDSTLALHEMAASGHRPGVLLTMFNNSQSRSWFHGASRAMLRAYENALGVPLWSIPSAGGDYASAFERALAMARRAGMEACAFGDIDIEANKLWEEERCASAGLEAVFPLWQRPRSEIAREILRLGYTCIIKSINMEKFPHAPPGEIANLCETYLGLPLDMEFLRRVHGLGGDSCGENGEYHTLAVDGPVFRRPLRWRPGRILQFSSHAAREIDFI